MNESFDAEDDATLADNLQRFIEHLYYGFWMRKKAAQLLFTELSLCLLEKISKKLLCIKSFNLLYLRTQ